MQRYNKRYIFYLIIVSIFTSSSFTTVMWANFIPEDGEVSVNLLYALIGSLIGAIILSIIFAILTWYFTTYELTEDGLVLKKGILFKITKIVPYEKVHAIDTQQNLLHMIFGLKKLSIDSGSTTRADLVEIKIVEKNVITIALEKEIRDRMTLTKGVKVVENNDEVENDNEVIYHYSKKQKFIVSLIQLIIFIVISIPFIATVATLIMLIPDSEFVKPDILLIFGIVVGLWFIMFISTYLFNIIRYYNYRVFLKDDYLLINHGLITKYNNTLPLNKIKAVKIEENIIERLFKFCRIKVEVVGFGLQNGDNKQVINFFIPLCYKAEVNNYISKLGLKYEYKPRAVKSPRKALKYFYSLSLYIFGIIYLTMLPIMFYTGEVIMALAIYGGVFLLIGILIYLSSLLSYFNSGLYIDDDLVIVNNGSFNKKSTIILRENIITVDKIDTYCRRKKNIASFNIHYFNNALKNVEKVHLLDVDNINELKEAIIY